MADNTDLLAVRLSLAAKIGVEAACVYAALHRQFVAERETMAQLTALVDSLQQALPFLQQEQIMQSLPLLEEQALLTIGAGGKGAAALTVRTYSGAQAEDAAAAAAAADPKPPESMTLDWTPPPYVVQALGNYGIAEDFCGECLDQFRVYWMEKGGQRQWGSLFMGWVRRGWENGEAERAARQTAQADSAGGTSISTSNWDPSIKIYSAIERRAIPESFARKQLESFRTDLPVYRGEPEGLESMFVTFVCEQWDIQRITTQTDGEETQDGQPRADPTGGAADRRQPGEGPRLFGEILTGMKQYER